jgi:predicted dehydrogenase
MTSVANSYAQSHALCPAKWLLNGFHVVCDKPVTFFSLEEAEELKKDCGRNRIIIRFDAQMPRTPDDYTQNI